MTEFGDLFADYDLANTTSGTFPPTDYNTTTFSTDYNITTTESDVTMAAIVNTVGVDRV